MKVVIKKAGQMPEVKEIENELKPMQEIVGGDIEPFRMFDGIICVCNEDGKYNGLQPNFVYASDIIVGDVFFCSASGEEFDSLTDEQIEMLMTFLNIFELRKRQN